MIENGWWDVQPEVIYLSLKPMTKTISQWWVTCHTWIDTLLWETFSRPAWHWDWNKTLVMTKNTSIFVLAHCHYFLCFYLSSMLQSSFTSVYNEPVFQAKIKHFIRWLFSTNCVHFQCWNEDWILALALVRTKMSGPGSEVDRRYCYKLINFCSFSVFGKLADLGNLQRNFQHNFPKLTSS